MNCTFASGSVGHEISICKLVTGELIIGRVNTSSEVVTDVGLIIPREVKPEENNDNKFGFYVVPYGFPMVQRILGETISLASIIKVFPPLGGFEDVVTMYIQITTKEAEQAATQETNTNG
jgi:hypothetical protein